MYETEREVIKILKRNKIDVISTLPCEKIEVLLDLVAKDPAFCHVALNREENGVGISAGVYLAHGKPAMIIQSTGLGNSINALMSLSVTYEMPLPIIASWRGVYKEKIPAQIPFGKSLPNVLHALELPYTIIEDPSKIELVEDVILDAYANEKPHIALISPKTWEKDRGKEESIAPTPVSHRKRSRKYALTLKYEKEIKEPEMGRYDAIRILSEYLREEAVVSNIGVPSKELYAAKDRDLNFYMLGSLGQVSAIGLGISLKTKRETIVLDGDGSLLMSSILPTIGTKKPRNLSIICLDNGTWGSTGDQPTQSFGLVDLELMAINAGIEDTIKVHTEKELKSALERLYDEEGPRFVHVIIKPGNAEVGNIKLTPKQIKRRFMKAMAMPLIAL